MPSSRPAWRRSRRADCTDLQPPARAECHRACLVPCCLLLVALCRSPSLSTLALASPSGWRRGCCCHRTPDPPPRPRRRRPACAAHLLPHSAPAAPGTRTCECHCESLRCLCLALSADAAAYRACARAACAVLAARRLKTPRGTRWSRAAVDDAPRMKQAPARSHCSRTALSRTPPCALPV
jgi:hypothetical protein